MNGLQLTVGVPGSGKTQLAREFGQRIKGDTVNERTVSTLLVTPEILDDPLSLFMRMAVETGTGQQATQIAQIDHRISNVTGGALTATFGVARDVGRHTPAFPALLDISKQQGMWDGKALVLMVDELQRVDGEGMKSLCVLHDGNHECPILLLGFGLQHTPMLLANRSDNRTISRIVAPTVLEPLDRDDTLDAFANNLSCLGYDDVPPDSLAALAAASHGFPQHIHGYLEGAHRALTHHGHLTDASLKAALRHGHDRRVAYYEDRLSNGNSYAPMLAVMAAMEHAGATQLDYHHAQHVLSEAGFGVDELDKAIAHGSLAHVRHDVSFGIPSFHTHMSRLLANKRMAER